jgi:hypothetical protein
MAAAAQAGHCVSFEYCISLGVASCRVRSKAYFVAPGVSLWPLQLRYSLISLFLGWWGIPWGPILSALTLIRNFRGGHDCG